MHRDEPLNPLEQAFMAAARGPEGLPGLFKQLVASELAALMPYHPEMEGLVEIRQGSGFQFLVWQHPERGLQVPLFTSEKRALESLDKLGANRQPSCMALIPGTVLFASLAGQKYGVVINPGCSTGEIFLDLKTVRSLADGSLLKPGAPAPLHAGRVSLVDPAEYPTGLVQPVFRFLTGQENVRAAWIFQEQPTPTPGRLPTGPGGYVIGLLVDGDPAPVMHDFSLVVSGLGDAPSPIGLTVLSSEDPVQADLMKRFPAFYAAPDFHSALPPGLDERELDDGDEGDDGDAPPTDS